MKRTIDVLLGDGRQVGGERGEGGPRQRVALRIITHAVGVDLAQKLPVADRLGDRDHPGAPDCRDEGLAAIAGERRGGELIEVELDRVGREAGAADHHLDIAVRRRAGSPGMATPRVQRCAR